MPGGVGGARSGILIAPIPIVHRNKCDNDHQILNKLPP
jgi:hypothetical protein